jgi:hypothetical protein
MAKWPKYHDSRSKSVTKLFQEAKSSWYEFYGNVRG